MKKAKLDLSELMVMLRQQGYFNLQDVQTAIFEYNGKLSVLPVNNKRPATPEDMKLSPEQEYISTEIIMDGRVLGENLERMGADKKWLDGQLKVNGYSSAKEVFLALCDENKQLVFFKGE